MSESERSVSNNSTEKVIETNSDDIEVLVATAAAKERKTRFPTEEPYYLLCSTIVPSNQESQVLPARALERNEELKPLGSSTTFIIEQNLSSGDIIVEVPSEVRTKSLIQEPVESPIFASRSAPGSFIDGIHVKQAAPDKELTEGTHHQTSDIPSPSISSSPRGKSKLDADNLPLLSSGPKNLPIKAASIQPDSFSSGTEATPFSSQPPVTGPVKQKFLSQTKLRQQARCTMSTNISNGSFHRQQQQQQAQLRQVHDREGQTFVIRPIARRTDNRVAASLNSDFLSDSHQADDLDSSSNLIRNSSTMQENENSGYHPIGHPRNVATSMQPPSSSSSVASSIGASLHNNANNLINMQFDGPETGHNQFDYGETYEDGNFADAVTEYSAGTWMTHNRNSATSSSSCGWTDVMGTATANTAGNMGPGTTMMPSPRSLHSAAILNGVLYVFGGYDGNQRVNSFHAYTFADKRWSPVLPSANSGNPPSPRDRHVSVAFGNSFYVHGGFDGTARDASLFSFDFSTMAWREVIASFGRPPSARHSHAAVVYDHSMYVFGGYDGSYKSDLHEFDFTSSRWNSVPAVGRRPRPRYRATCVVYKNCMILYGGHDGTRHLSDTFTFDFDTLTWNALLTDGTQPIPRDSHVSVVHGNSMYVFGGSSGVAMNDFHELQLPIVITSSASSNNSNGTVASNGQSAVARWRPIHTTSSTTARSDGQQYPRHRFCHVAVTYNDSMYVFGGYDGADRLNSFIRFDFAVYDLSFEIPNSTLVQDFRSLVNNQKLSDITFIVQDQPIYAHKLMLMRCSYFQALFCGNMRESNMDTIQIEQVRYPIFLGILEYLYTDQVRTIPFHTAMEYFEAADLFCIPRLKTICEKVMLQNITQSNAASIFHAADLHSATALREKAKKYILNHFEDVSKTNAFEDMGRQNVDLVFELLHSR